MNIGKMTFKHGHILMTECYILRVKAVDVEYIGKYKDESVCVPVPVFPKDGTKEHKKK